MTARVLVFGWGNLSRGDDALGPLAVQRLGAAAPGDIEFLDDHQLQPEHALDLVGREQVLFIDASLTAPAPFEATAVHAARDRSFSSHAMSPQALLQVCADLYGGAPAATLLAIRGERFVLGEAPGPAAMAHLDAAVAWALRWLAASLREPAHA